MTESSVAPWGDEFTPGGKHMANTWQGDFPHQNLATDGSGRHWFLYFRLYAPTEAYFDRSWPAAGHRENQVNPTKRTQRPHMKTAQHLTNLIMITTLLGACAASPALTYDPGRFSFFAARYSGTQNPVPATRSREEGQGLLKT
jgi:hypothetical protein